MYTYAARTVSSQLEATSVEHGAKPRTCAQTTSHPLVVQRMCSSCEEEESVARFTEDDRTLATVPPIVGEVNRSSGSPLDAGLRTRYETAFGWNFANVRIHADDRAAQGARAVNARAYTSGNHVVFGDGEFAPESAGGQRLLAHELAHVVQQSTGPVRPGISRPGDDSEREADRLAMGVGDAISSEPAGAAIGHRGFGMSAPYGDGGVTLHSNIGAADQAVQRWPGDGMLPPGDCDWATYTILRGAVEIAKAVVNALGSCTANDSCEVLAGKIAAITTEIAARVALDTTCFRGGDAGHREQVQARVNMLNRCYHFFVNNGVNCPALLAAAAAAALAAIAAAEAAEHAAAAAEVEETVATTTELIEGAAATGEAVEGGVTLVEVLEGVALVLAL